MEEMEEIEKIIYAFLEDDKKVDAILKAIQRKGFKIVKNNP